MERCLQLAVNGRGNTSPNPMVGCVIVKDDKIIGEGYHTAAGKPHAEVKAVKSVVHKEKIKGSTVYVNLEPCAHYGKTPPCANLIVKYRPKRVVIANRDPFKQVDGRGIDILKKEGIEIVTGVLEQKGKFLNRRFFTFHTRHRPYVILKWAETQDGFIAPPNQNTGKIFWISSKESRQLVHQWRTEEAGIMTGKNTVLQDDPQLTARLAYGKHPVRILLDSGLSIDASCACMSDTAPVIIINKISDKKTAHLTYLSCDMRPGSILSLLYEQNIQSVIIEGGQRVLAKFIEAGLWDEARIFKSEKFLGSGLKAPHISKVNRICTEHIHNDLLSYIYND